MALDFFAGSVGGIAGVVVGHPFDTVKVRLQTQPASVYAGMVDCFSKIIKQESVLALYKGLLPPLAGFAAMNAVTFGVQGNVYRKLEPCTKNLFLSGVIAGLVQSSIVCPIELVKTRMQLQGQGESYKHVIRNKNAMYSSSVDCIRKIYRTGGIRACYRGMVPTLAREGPSVGVYIALYHKLCAFFSKNPEDLHKLGVGYLLLAGGIAGSSSWIITYPIDVVKSRIQGDITHGQQYKGILDCFKKILHSEGFQGYFRGMATTIVRAFPVNAVTLATVTLILRAARAEEII